MTLGARFAVCPVCHGVHKGIPECVGRPQTDTEWMVDRGVRPEVAASFARARGNRYPPMAIAPDPLAPPGPPFGVPPPAQGALF